MVGESCFVDRTRTGADRAASVSEAVGKVVLYPITRIDAGVRGQIPRARHHYPRFIIHLVSGNSRAAEDLPADHEVFE